MPSIVSAHSQSCTQSKARPLERLALGHHIQKSPNGLAGAPLVLSSPYRVTLPLLFGLKEIFVPYVRGFLVDVLLAILALYVEGYIRSERETSAGEPSDVAAQKLRSSLGTIKEEVHEATR